MRLLHCVGLLFFLTFQPLEALGQSDLKMADLGSCSLEKGGTIENCRLVYRTYGQLNASRTNAIFFPTWFGGTTENLVEFVGPDRMLDSTKYFVVLIDAFGNGLSSSPSNSDVEPKWKFPEFTIRDIVDAEHRLATEHLNLPRLHAVVGISMGGMQAYQWAVSYPDFLEKAVSIVGTPRLTPYDVLLWVTELGAIELAGRDTTAQRRAMEVVARIHSLANQTPERVSEDEDFEAQLQSRVNSTMARDPLDWASQLRAMLSHDIYAPFDRLEDVADVIQADVLVIVDEQDHMVNPRPSRQFAEITGARLIEYDTECGHGIFICEREAINREVADFLAGSTD